MLDWKHHAFQDGTVAYEHEDFEDVPSPFRKSAVRNTTTTKTPPRSNMFSRPMGTAPTEAPTVVENVTRRSPARPEQTDFLESRRRPVNTPQIDYLEEEEIEEDEIEEDEDEEVVERRVVKAKPRAPKVKPKVDLLPRIGWGIVALCFLRLIFMERGVIDYLGMDGRIKDGEQELSRIKAENTEIEGEIRRISLDKSYQRQLAKEHLGVIAADEFLILFAGESEETGAEADRRL